MKGLYRLRVILKLWMRGKLPVNSFCRECGRDVRDFSAPDEAWAKVQPLIRVGNTLCYECFCDLWDRVGGPPGWRLVPLTDDWIMAYQYAHGASVDDLVECFKVSRQHVQAVVASEMALTMREGPAC